MGALTNKPMAFNSRNWEYNSQITHDLTDFLTPKIRVDQFSGKIYRILPTVEWISNKIRFLYLGLRNQRIVSPLFIYKYKLNIHLSDRELVYTKRTVMTNRFEKSFQVLRNRISNNKKKNVNLIIGALFEAKLDFFNLFENSKTKVNKFLEISSNNVVINKLPEISYGDYLFFGVNPRMESPLLNLKIRENNSRIYSIGNLSFNYPVSIIDNSNYSFVELNKGKFFSSSLAFFGLSTINLTSN